MKTTFLVRLEKELHEKLRQEAFKNETSMNELIVKLIKKKYEVKK